MKKFTLGICAFVLSLSLGWSLRVRADAVTEWNANAAITTRGLIPPHESRLYAMMHLAIHDALNTINRRFHPYALDIQGPSEASAKAAVATAAHDVLVPALKQLVPVFYQIPAIQDCIAGKDGIIASIEADYTAALADIPKGTPKMQGIVIGHAAAAVILALRVADGSDTLVLDFDYPQGTHPGEYRFTPEAPFAGLPGWEDVTPFVLHDSAQFRPGPPYAVTSPKYTADFNEVKRLGARIGSTRTAEQTQIALFWVESPLLQWNRIARAVSQAAGLDMWEHARLFALLNMALADGNIGTTETKYHYNTGGHKQQFRQRRPTATRTLVRTRRGCPLDPSRLSRNTTPRIVSRAALRHRCCSAFSRRTRSASVRAVRHYHAPHTSAVAHRRCAARFPVSLRPQRKTASRASMSGTIFAKQSKRGLHTGGRLPIAPSIASCGPWTEGAASCCVQALRHTEISSPNIETASRHTERHGAGTAPRSTPSRPPGTTTVRQQEQAMAEHPPAKPAPPRGRPKRPQGAQRVRVLTLRLPEELLRRLDAYTAQMQTAQPYLRLSRTDVLRMLLDQGLPAAR